MSYCQQLFEKLNAWKESFDELEKAKNAYLGLFKQEAEKRYQEIKNIAEQREREYKERKESCFTEIEFAGPVAVKERIFGPDLEAAERMWETLGKVKTVNGKRMCEFFPSNIRVEDGRVVEIYLAYSSRENSRDAVTDTMDDVRARTEAFDNIKYFTRLKELRCNNNNLIRLPALPESLVYLDCESNALMSLPELPNGLLELRCGGNHLKKIAKLPDNLKRLDLRSNLVRELPQNLPGNIKVIDCAFNRLSGFPDLPAGLEQLVCDSNKIKELPSLPAGLRILYCRSNKLSRGTKKELVEYSKKHPSLSILL